MTKNYCNILELFNDSYITICNGYFIMTFPILCHTGSIIRKIEFPAARITSCCFGGPNYDEMFVTSATWATDPEEDARYPLAGSLFKVTGLGVKGTPGCVYQG